MNNPKEKTKNKKHKRGIIIALAITICLVAIDVTFTGYMKFGYYFVKCGGMPVKVTHTAFWGGETWYNNPGYYTPGGVQNVWYYCTEQEVINNGVREDLYDRDHSRQRPQ